MSKSQLKTPVRNAVHLCIDMQNIFVPGGIWATPWIERVLPVIVHIAELCPVRTVFTRFVTPVSPDDRPGQWRRYFRKWECATGSRLDPAQLDLVPPLARLAPPATVIDKPAYSAFFQSSLTNFLTAKDIDTLIVSGSETDVCVLSTVLDAVDLGYRVIVMQDALCSSLDDGHDALMTLYRTRFSEQIELVTSAEVARLWADPRG